MSNPVAVKWFDSTMSGAPVLTGEAGKLIEVLDACLLADGSGGGFGTVTLSSLVVASGVATATVNTGHGFLDHVVVKIAGATPSGLNGDQRITRTGTNTFTFDATGISDQTATGTITAKMSPLGWVKSYSGTNKAAYARSSVLSTAMLLRVDDTPAQYPTLIMYEAMTGIDTGTGPAPTSSSLYFAKSSTANSTARAWRLYADDLAFYLFVNADSSTWPSAMFFGDIIPYRSGDAYHCQLLAHSAGNTTSHLINLDGTTTGGYLSRSYTQVGTAVTASRYSHRKCQYLGSGGMVTPNLVDNALHNWPVECWESNTLARGKMPGLYCPVHDNSIADGTIYTQGTGKILIQRTYSASYECAMDMTGPWR